MFHRFLSQHSVPPTPESASGLRLRILHPFQRSGAGHLQALQDCGVALPGTTVAWATPLEPLQPTPSGLGATLWQPGGVPLDAAVGVVLPAELSGEPLAQDGQPAGAGRLTPRGEALARGPACLPCGPAVAVIVPLALLAPPPLAPRHSPLGCPARRGPLPGRRRGLAADRSRPPCPHRGPHTVAAAVRLCLGCARAHTSLRVAAQPRSRDRAVCPPWAHHPSSTSGRHPLARTGDTTPPGGLPVTGWRPGPAVSSPPALRPFPLGTALPAPRTLSGSAP